MKSPFSLYDFIGYFFPGFVSLVIVLIFYSFYNDYIVLLKETNSICLYNNDKEIIISGSIHIYAFTVILSYIVGHLVNYLSSITVEKYSIWKYGYPSHFLLRIDRPKYYKFREIEDVKSWIKNTKNGYFTNILKTIKYHLISSNNKFFNKVGCIRIRAFFWRFCLIIFLSPITLLDCLIGKVLGLNLYYTNKLDDSLVRLLNKKLNKTLVDMGVNDNKLDFQRIINHYYYEKFTNHNNRLDNYVSLYGFLRGLSFVFSTASILFIFENYVISIIFAFVAYIFYMAFMKFYRRFSLENFMCFLVDENFNLTTKVCKS